MLAEVAAVKCNKLTSEPDVSNDVRSSQTDVPFDDKLKAEEGKLAKKETLLKFVPWTYVQNLINSLPLKFDFDFSAAALESNWRNGQRAPDANTLRTETSNSKPAFAQAENSGVGSSASPAKLSYVIDQNSFIRNLLSHSKYAVGYLPISLNLADIKNTDARSIDLSLIVDELVDKIKLIKEGEKVELSLSLSPEHLGEMLLSVSMRNGLIFISITATKEAKELIEANRSVLEENLKKANINLGNLDVSSGGDREPFALWYLVESKSSRA